MKFKAVLLDIDGTLLDTSDFVFKAVEYTLKTHHLTTTEQKIEKAKGRPLVEFYKYLFPDDDYMSFCKTHDDFQKSRFDLTKPIPGVEEVLKKLKSEGFLIAAVSNRLRDSIVKSLKIEKIDKYFDVIVAIGDVENPKPHPDHPLKAMELLGVGPTETIIVGDTENDILAGKAAGIQTVGVTYGWVGEGIKKSNPDFVIDNIEELLKIV